MCISFMSNLATSQRKWLFNPKWSLYLQDPLLKLIKRPFDLYEHWRGVAKILKISKEGRNRLEWIIYWRQGRTKRQTGRHFGISGKTFYKWWQEFDEDNLYSLYRLQDKSRAPLHTRDREITSLQEQRVINLRKQHLKYGKMKIQPIYQREYGKWISTWHIQKVIEKWNLYPNPIVTAKIQRKRKRAQKKKRITELELGKMPWYKKTAGYIICLDTIAIYWTGLKRYIFTAIDKFGKFAFARMYKNKSSFNGEDFLRRLYYLCHGQVPRVGHDNGTEFEKYFKSACQKLNIEQYYNRPRTPKDNPESERFNQTLQYEFLAEGTFNPDPEIFNKQLTEWLIEYNFRRPHESLGYRTPMEFSSKVLPMYSSCTRG